MLYDTAARPPRPGSILETLFIMVQIRREASRLMEVRSVVQALQDESETGQATQEAFNDFRLALMPYLMQDERDARKQFREVMNRELRMGPMRVRPVEVTPRVRSRLQAMSNRIRQAGRVRWGQ